MPLSVDDKARVAHHLGHPNLSEAATWALGIPAATEQNSLLLRAIGATADDPGLLVEARLPQLRKILCALDELEAAPLRNAQNAAVSSVGNISMRTADEAGVGGTYDYWLSRLEDYLGCPRNPFSRAGGSINVRVA